MEGKKRFWQDFAQISSVSLTDKIIIGEDASGNPLYGVVSQLSSALSVSSIIKGVAIPATDPGMPANGETWLAGQPGTYINFKDNTGTAIIITSDEILTILFYNGTSWVKQLINITIDQVKTLGDLDSTEDVTGTLVNNSYWNDSGNTASYRGVSRTDYIPVSPTDTLMVKANSATTVYCWFFDSSHVKITGSSFKATLSDLTAVTIPATAAFFAASGDPTAIQIVKKYPAWNTLALKTDIDIDAIDDSKTFVFNNSSEKYEDCTSTTAVGWYSAVGLSITSHTDAGYSRMTVSNVAGMTPIVAGYDYYYTGVIDQTNQVGIIYYDDSRTIKGTQITTSGTYTRQALIIPDGATYISGCSKGTLLIEGRYKQVSVPPRTIYVDAASTSSVGSIARPYKTISEALLEAVNYEVCTIIIAGGTYRETLDFTPFINHDLTLMSKERENVRILGSDEITGWTKTTGYTNVYQASFSKTIPTWLHSAPNPIFQDLRPSRPITTTEKHPLQKGLTNRLPFTPILEVADIETVDSTPGTYYYDTDSSILYMHNAQSADPEVDSYNYEVIQRDWATGPRIDQKPWCRSTLRMIRINFFYGASGFRSWGWQKVERYYCSAFAQASSGGAWQDDMGMIFSYKDEAGYSTADGFNSHYVPKVSNTGDDARMGVTYCRYVEPWAHDNWDDGLSTHERTEVTLMGGLSEYNADSGARAAAGANWVVHNLYSRKNGWQKDGYPASGEGIACVNVVDDGRAATICIAFNCVSENNTNGYGCKDDANNTLILVDCVSRNNDVSEVYSQDNATVILKNCKATNSDTAKIKIIRNGGIIKVENDDLIT